MSNFTPLTLSIIPTTSSQVNRNSVIPQFQYVPQIPEIPEIKNTRGPLKDLTVEEREQHRLQNQRERNQRRQEKIKKYTKLGKLPSNKDKIYELLLLCEPSLIHRDKAFIEERIMSFLRDVGL